MKCEICGKSPADGETTLFRQNAKGQSGIWRCEEHNHKFVPLDVAQTVAKLQYLKKGSYDA